MIDTNIYLISKLPNHQSKIGINMHVDRFNFVVVFAQKMFIVITQHFKSI